MPSSDKVRGAVADLRPRPSLLPEDIGLRVDEMRKACPGIDQVWLLRHQYDPPEWDLLAFADRRSLETLRGEEFGRPRPDVQVLVVVDGERFEPAWGKRAAGSLRDIEWQLEDAETATFTPPDGVGREAARMTAVRVR